MEDSIFTKIIQGDIPCHKVYEDAKTFAFLDIHPLLPGHVLIVPKVQVDQFDDLPEEDYAAVFETVRKIAKRVKQVMPAKRAIVNVLGYDVPHAHIHVLPSDTGRSFYEAIEAHLHGNDATPSTEELAEIATKLRMEDEL